jgi:hypothetical protein
VSVEEFEEVDHPNVGDDDLNDDILSNLSTFPSSPFLGWASQRYIPHPFPFRGLTIMASHPPQEIPGPSTKRMA